MLVVETIARIRREHLGKGTPIRKLVRDLPAGGRLWSGMTCCR